MLAVWLGGSTLVLLATTSLLRRLANRVPTLVMPGLLASCAMAIGLSAVGAAATRSGIATLVVAALGMSGLVLVVWIPGVYREARRGRRVRVLDPDQASAIHKAAYRAAGVASLLALGTSIYLGVELWLDPRSQRRGGISVPLLLALVFLLGTGATYMIRRYRHRATTQLLVLTLGAALVPRGRGIPAAVLFLLATLLNFLATKKAKYANSGAINPES
jgi:uncharacterized membrane protein YhaH (DUF805 family)